VVPTIEGREQSACARWSAAAVARARTNESRALGALLDADDATFVPFDDWGDVLTDVDTQDDLKRLGLS
jgi:hypothetical protein